MLKANINNIILKYNSHFDKVNLLCANKKIENLFDVQVVRIKLSQTTIKKYVTFICVDGKYNEVTIDYVNWLLKNNIKVCLIVQLDFDFNKFTKHINTSNIDAISWRENGQKSPQYLIIV